MLEMNGYRSFVHRRGKHIFVRKRTKSSIMIPDNAKMRNVGLLKRDAKKKELGTKK